MRREELRVGVFDSGLGGLTVVKALLEHIPGIDIVYIADTANAPYGEKSHEQIRIFSEKIADYLILHHGIDALVVACNTATSAAISYLRQLYPNLPIVGTEPGIKPAMNTTKSHKVGILATPATLAGDKYQELADKLYKGTDITLYEQACPGLVEQIESGEVDSPRTRNMLEEWLVPMKKAGVDTIVLGCTHYPLATHVIEEIMDNQVELIETGGAIARRLRDLLGDVGVDGDSTIKILATGDIDSSITSKILNRDLSVEPLSL